MSLKVTVNDKEVAHLIKGLKNQIGDVPWSAIGQHVVDSIHKNFDEGGRPDPWPPKKSGEECHLIDTGALRASVDYKVKKNGVEIAYGKDYGTYHILGTSRLPIRDFMEIQPEDWQDLDTLLDDHWDKLLSQV